MADGIADGSLPVPVAFFPLNGEGPARLQSPCAKLAAAASLRSSCLPPQAPSTPCLLTMATPCCCIHAPATGDLAPSAMSNAGGGNASATFGDMEQPQGVAVMAWHADEDWGQDVLDCGVQQARAGRHTH